MSHSSCYEGWFLRVGLIKYKHLQMFVEMMSFWSVLIQKLKRSVTFPGDCKVCNVDPNLHCTLGCKLWKNMWLPGDCKVCNMDTNVHCKLVCRHWKIFDYINWQDDPLKYKRNGSFFLFKFNNNRQHYGSTMVVIGSLPVYHPYAGDGPHQGSSKQYRTHIVCNNHRPSFSWCVHDT